MPAIRDWTFNYTTSTSGTTISAPLPAYQAGDLLLAILSSDTTAGTWSRSGWTQLFSTTNTCGLAVFWKIATAGEVDPVFTATTAETYNLHLISIRDVNTSTPFNGTGGAGTGYRTATNSAAVASMPQLTTTVPNSLVLYIVSESGTVVPGVHQGPVTFEDAADGYAHSEGFSWGFMPTAGPTPTTVKCNKNGTAAGVLATIGISPPAGGATVIPAYCAADASIYVDPIHGTTAFNGNTAFAATLTTHFGTSINGKTAANGTAAAAADVGINSFHNMGQVTGTATAGTWAGAALVLATANKPNVAGKNVLCHVKPSTPKVYQNTDPLAKVGVKGVFFGMCSTSASAFKVWHVHGAGTPWDSAQHVPIVINSLNTSGLIQSTGSLNPASIASFGFGVSGFTVAPVFQFGSLWVLDTTVIAGGNAAEPVNVAGINKVCSTGKERMSVLQQGAGQILVLQPVQFGDGGTNPLYLNLDSTAIEFPQHYNLGAKQVFYCSADDVAGLTYYAGAGDTITHTNSVVSSLSKYHWKIHASSSPSATYNFDGLSVIGAGTVQLAAGIPISGVTFSGCGTIPAAGASLTNCLFKATTGSVAVSAASTAEVAAIKSSQFTGNARGIKLTSPGTYTFDALEFSGNTYDIENASTGAVIVNLINGSNPTTYINTAGGTTTLITVVNIVLNNVKFGTRYSVLRASDGVVLYSGTASTTTVTIPHDYTGDLAVRIRLRNSNPIPPRYLPFETQGTVTSSGLSVYANQVVDGVALSLAPLVVNIEGDPNIIQGSYETFSCTPYTGATYTWTVIAGSATITSGQGTAAVVVSDSTAESVTLRVQVVTETGAGTAVLENIVCSPVTMTAPSATVTGATEPYSVPARTGAAYNWSITSGSGSITSGQGTNSVTVSSSAAGSLGVQCVVTTPTGGSGTANATPSVTTVAITGAGSLTLNVASNFSVPVVAGASYNWSITSGTGSIESGQGTDTVSVKGTAVGSLNLQCVVTTATGGTSTATKTGIGVISNPISVISTNYKQANTVTSIATNAFAVQAGDIIVATFCNDTMSTNVSSWSDSDGNTYTEVAGSPGASYDSTHGLANLKVYTAVASATNAALVLTANLSAFGAYATITATVIRGAVQHAVNCIDQKAYITPYTATTAGATHSGPQITTTNANDLLWAIWQQDMTSGNNTMTAVDGTWTRQSGYIDTWSSGAATGIFTKSVSATGTYRSQITNALATSMAHCIIAFKQA